MFLILALCCSVNICLSVFSLMYFNYYIDWHEILTHAMTICDSQMDPGLILLILGITRLFIQFCFTLSFVLISIRNVRNLYEAICEDSYTNPV